MINYHFVIGMIVSIILAFIIVIFVNGVIVNETAERCVAGVVLPGNFSTPTWIIILFGVSIILIIIGCLNIRKKNDKKNMAK